MTAAMTRSERDELAKLVRRREKLAKGDIVARAAVLLADFEKQLATQYDPWDSAWADAYERTQQTVIELNRRIAKECEHAGVPPQLAPSASMGWSHRGENVSASRRAELRNVATSRIAASEKAAKVQVERQSVELQTELVAGGLESEAAKAFLDAMPTAEELMPSLSVREIEAQAEVAA